ncbi:MAG: hypothetical protein M0011_03840 [Elusimicrobia bacterium]|nr:hypothetical protein [Elusimicrobiota bacterium]
MKKTGMIVVMLMLAAAGAKAADLADLQRMKTADLALMPAAEVPLPKAAAAVERRAEFKFKCYGVDDNQPYDLEKLTLRFSGRDTMYLSFDMMDYVTEKYVAVPGYTPQAGSSLVGFRKFNVVDPHSGSYADGPLFQFYAEEQLMDGGYKLKNGKMGGYIKTPGAGYSFAKYICMR